MRVLRLHIESGVRSESNRPKPLVETYIVEATGGYFSND
jgi:hypothetical protein